MYTCTVCMYIHVYVHYIHIHVHGIMCNYNSSTLCLYVNIEMSNFQIKESVFDVTFYSDNCYVNIQHVHTCTHMYAHVHTYKCTYMYMCHVHMSEITDNTHDPVKTLVLMHEYTVHTCTCICIFTNVHVHTYVHVQ